MKNTIMKEKYLVIAFNTTAMAYYMEKLRRDDNLEGRLIPLPKQISAGCGAAFATKKIDIEFWKKYMLEKKVQYELMQELEL